MQRWLSSHSDGLKPPDHEAKSARIARLSLGVSSDFRSVVFDMNTLEHGRPPETIMRGDVVYNASGVSPYSH